MVSEKDNPVPEMEILVKISDDKMEATLYINRRPGTSPVTESQIYQALKDKGVIFGINEEAVREAVRLSAESSEELIKIVVARGKEVEHGRDAQITYHFPLPGKAKPIEREDGTVDFYNLNLVHNVRAGEVLATKIPAVPGEPGITVTGQMIRPLPGKNINFRRGKNTIVDKDGCAVVATTAGHVVLIDGIVHVFPVYEVNGDVDLSTGNINFVGNVIVRGNVKSGFIVKAEGNIEVHGTVEGGSLYAEGNIEVKKGIMGQGRGIVWAKGSVFARFVENGEIQAGENVVIADAIMNSNVSAGKCIIVEGRRGVIVGGVCRAAEEIKAKVIGSLLAPPTQVEVGVKPEIRQAYKQTTSDLIAREKNLEKVQQVLGVLSYVEKTRGELPPEKQELLARLRMTESQLLREIKELRQKKQALEEELAELRRCKVRVSGTIYPGVTVVIGQLTMHVNDPLQYVTLTEDMGDIKIYPYF